MTIPASEGLMRERAPGKLRMKKVEISKLAEFDAAEYLNSEEDVAAYLATVLEENDPALLAAALGDIARARAMSQVAKEAGIARREPQ